MNDFDVERPILIGFSANGILGKANYTLKLGGTTTIIVGPNGTGKSTFLSLFYLFITRQWSRLREFEFESLTLHHSEGDVTLNKVDIISYEPPSSKHSVASRFAERIYQYDLFDLVYKPSLTREEREKFSSAVSVPIAQVNSFRKYIQTEFNFSQNILHAERAIQKLDIGKVIYLPTYRRIEKDIKSIFPDIEARIRSKMEESGTVPRTGAEFIEIASFGMSDINTIIENNTSDVKEFQRLTSDSASQEYIRDIVSGAIKKYSLTNLRKMSDHDFEEFKNRLDDKLFSPSDREDLRNKITDLRKKNYGQPNAESRYLGMFVEKLLDAHNKVKDKERPIRDFVNIISDYLKPEKKAVLRGHTFGIFSNDKDELPIPLEKLSSGEKQIVSIFAYLLLTDHSDFIVLIDEPELSLSVPWQKKFLTDILGTFSCSKLIAVTHSPYVFDNELKNKVVDVRRLRNIKNG